ncbi:cob(I)yrinic acid a,c-diamide adenosyltransferase, partial [Klebsiella pneumoniae]|uniref:cob(I)yrinic acid a,c-diamide adenosyltransferase n=1 Tax=Klebsiella pneumoniae TaxID=573 RepID=UPI00214C3FDE
RMLADDQLDLVLLDELTYMVAYDYLPLESVLSALRERPAHQSAKRKVFTKLISCNDFSRAKKNGIRCAENTKHKDFSPAAEVH